VDQGARGDLTPNCDPGGKSSVALRRRIEIQQIGDIIRTAGFTNCKPEYSRPLRAGGAPQRQDATSAAVILAEASQRGLQSDGNLARNPTSTP